jgi:ATP-binding cassette subfamily B protein
MIEVWVPVRVKLGSSRREFARSWCNFPGRSKGILLLDEATSSVDAVTEGRVQEALGRLLAGRTSFVVAHRLSTIRHADQVLGLDARHIAERGSHRELLRHGGRYAELYREFASVVDLEAAT